MMISIAAEHLYFTSDTHFFHRAMVERRGFSSIDQMNDALINNWNHVVPPTGVVIHLGDVSFGGTVNTVSVLGQLNGRIHLVQGNHDRGMSSTARNMFATVQDYLEVRVTNIAGLDRIKVICSHYAHRVWNEHHHGSLHVYGHSHGSLPGQGRSMDVGVDTNTGAPYSFEDIYQKLSSKPIHEVDYHKGRSK